MRVELHTAPLHELIDSARYYESRLPGLGTDFRFEVDRKLRLLSENSEMGAIVEASYRCLLDSFPYLVIYRTRDSTLRVLAIAHQRRKPGY